MAPLDAEDIHRAYAAVHASRVQGATLLERLLSVLLAESVNFHDVSARAKDADSFCEKAAKHSPDGSAKYTDPMSQITDQVAARVITFIPEDVDRSCDVLRTVFEVVEEIDKGELIRQQGQFGYASKHLVLRLDVARAALPENACLRDVTFEVQVRTVVQHAWAEFEHGVRYKYPIPADIKPRFDRSFALVAALLEMADREFTQIDHLYQELAQATPAPTGQAEDRADRVADAVARTADAVRPEPAQQATSTVGPERRLDDPDQDDLDQVPLSASDLPSLLSKRYPTATRSRREHYEAMIKVLGALGITTTQGLDDALARIDTAAVEAAMAHQLPAGHIRRLEDDLLAAFGRRYLDASNIDDLSNRVDILTRRLTKLRHVRG